MNKQTKKQYSKEYKESCVQRALKIGNVAECARELGISYSMLSGWIQRFKASGSQARSLSHSMGDSKQLQELKRANARLREENAILKKATAYFSQNELRRGTHL